MIVEKEIQQLNKHIVDVLCDNNNHIADDISDYLSKSRKDREELEFYLNIFEKHNILCTCNTAGEEMIWSTCYKCNYQGVPFTMAYDNDYDMVSFSVDENNISQRRFVAEGIKELIEYE